MAKYLVITQNSDGTGRDVFRGFNHRRLAKWARAQNSLRGKHVTVVRADTGAIVLWIGSNLYKGE